MNFCWVGWCHEDNHDKVWGVFETGQSQYATFWGRRGKKLQTKTFVGSSRDLNKLIFAKQNKGYRGVSAENLDKVYDNFEHDVESTAIWAVLKG